MIRITEKALQHFFDSQGVEVVETLEGMTVDRQGWYNHAKRLVGVHPDLLERQRVPVLLHEAFHVLRHDDGEQPQAVEDRINEDVALLLVNPADYAFWESEFGWNAGGLAAALDLPRWVIEAYRRALSKSLVG